MDLKGWERKGCERVEVVRMVEYIKGEGELFFCGLCITPTFY